MILLTTLGLSYFTNKYIVKPIEELNLAAEQIMGGTFEGDLKADKGSAFYALQALLASGDKVLRRINEEMLEEKDE
ncbi:MAG: hypothetical protein A2V52_02515 [Actinobacteria bacterium RBG_19FT_COMBO_54_7]|uniref:HAMP domain-containing protein n=1 Tax=Candidatus Solincola sediminis TaxID=1797199 RepID=A0A1F2WJU0_9ACTN|nr:MAG: hypothetical protein A2W01_02780 [Candidatus Solincola sediminis]OFW57116.1 MAG: hypothetical protein A2Y75_01980 [Candidatus Solincola sediminis]OFW67417.1 MAG: hypothetical protein A2V52_02515 [Actinobacteria bacterium RBG_19FT_COMBO_54_7]